MWRIEEVMIPMKYDIIAVGVERREDIDHVVTRLHHHHHGKKNVRKG